MLNVRPLNGIYSADATTSHKYPIFANEKKKCTKKIVW